VSFYTFFECYTLSEIDALISGRGGWTRTAERPPGLAPPIAPVSTYLSAINSAFKFPVSRSQHVSLRSMLRAGFTLAIYWAGRRG